jgi:hypothetical protein
MKLFRTKSTEAGDNSSNPIDSHVEKKGALSRPKFSALADLAFCIQTGAAPLPVPVAVRKSCFIIHFRTLNSEELDPGLKLAGET